MVWQVQKLKLQAQCWLASSSLAGWLATADSSKSFFVGKREVARSPATKAKRLWHHK